MMSDAPGRTESLRAWSSRYVRIVLERCQGNKRRACDRLDISYHTLQSLLEYDVGTPGLPAADLTLDPVVPAPAS